MKHFFLLRIIIIPFFCLLSFLAKKNPSDFVHHSHQDEGTKQNGWKIIYEKAGSTTEWGDKYEWDESQNFFACGLYFHFTQYSKELIKNELEYKMVPNGLDFYMCNFNDWYNQWSFGNEDNNEPSKLMCPENNFIIGFQWYWTQEESVLNDLYSDFFRFKIICSPSLNFVGFNAKETKDKIMLFKDQLICGYQVGETSLKIVYNINMDHDDDEDNDDYEYFTISDGLQIKLCKSPVITEFWKSIEEEFDGIWSTAIDWSERYLDYYGCGLNLFFLKSPNDGSLGLNDYEEIQGIDFVACNINRWEDQKNITAKRYYNDSKIAKHSVGTIKDLENWDNEDLNPILQKCPPHEFITALQIQYSSSALCENLLKITGIYITCGKTWGIFENNWNNLKPSGGDKRFWKKKNYLLGGICGVSLKLNKDSFKKKSNEKGDFGLNGIKVKVCPQLYSNNTWQSVFNLTETVNKTISWSDGINSIIYKDYFGCGLILYTEKLKSPYAFLNPDFLMKISMVACKIDNWNKNFTTENIRNSNYDEYKAMCPPNEFIYGIQRYMIKSNKIQEEEKIKDDFFRFKIICGPSMQTIDVFSGNPHLYSMFFIEKTLDETIYFRNGLLSGYSYGFSEIELSLKMCKTKINNVIGSLSFQIIPVSKKEEFFSHLLKKSWISVNKVESNDGEWEKIIDWAFPVSNYHFAFKWHFTFEKKSSLLSGMGFFASDVSTKRTEKKIIGKSFTNFNSTCKYKKFINGIQFKRARVDNSEVLIGYRILCEFFDGNGTFSDWSDKFEGDIKGGYWDDPQFFIYGGKKAFLCGVAAKTKEIFFKNKKYKVIIDLDFKMCSFDYNYKPKEEIIKLEGSSEGEWMKVEEKVKLEGKEELTWIEHAEWARKYYACGVKISRDASSLETIQGIEFRFCPLYYGLFDDDWYFWQKIDPQYNGSWEKPINCRKFYYIAGLQLLFRNPNPIRDFSPEESNNDDDEIQKKGELVGFRILCRYAFYVETREQIMTGNIEEKWIDVGVVSKGIWGNRYYLEDELLICDVAGQKFEDKLVDLKIQTCKHM